MGTRTEGRTKGWATRLSSVFVFETAVVRVAVVGSFAPALPLLRMTSSTESFHGPLRVVPGQRKTTTGPEGRQLVETDAALKGPLFHVVGADMALKGPLF